MSTYPIDYMEQAADIHPDFGMETSYESLVAANCTSCGVTQDKSAYWTPALYFIYPNNTAEVVEQVGGMLA